MVSTAVLHKASIARSGRRTVRSWKVLHENPGGSRSSLALSRLFEDEEGAAFGSCPSASQSSAAAASQVLRSSTALHAHGDKRNVEALSVEITESEGRLMPTQKP